MALRCPKTRSAFWSQVRWKYKYEVTVGFGDANFLLGNKTVERCFGPD